MVLRVEAEKPRIDPAACTHEQFGASVEVSKLEDMGTFIAEIRVGCAQCGLPFSFTGLPLGISVTPSVTVR